MFDWFRKLVGLYDYTRVEELRLKEGELEVLKAVRDVFVQRAMGKISLPAEYAGAITSLTRRA